MVVSEEGECRFCVQRRRRRRKRNKHSKRFHRSDPSSRRSISSTMGSIVYNQMAFPSFNKRSMLTLGECRKRTTTVVLMFTHSVLWISADWLKSPKIWKNSIWMKMSLDMSVDASFSQHWKLGKRVSPDAVRLHWSMETRFSPCR